VRGTEKLWSMLEGRLGQHAAAGDCQEFCVRTVVFRPGENDPRTG
jgi:hypothetical protein